MFKPATLLKVTLLYGCFPRFLNCVHGTKSRNAPHILKEPSVLFQAQFLPRNVKKRKETPTVKSKYRYFVRQSFSCKAKKSSLLYDKDMNDRL